MVTITQLCSPLIFNLQLFQASKKWLWAESSYVHVTKKRNESSIFSLWRVNIETREAGTTMVVDSGKALLVWLVTLILKSILVIQHVAARGGKSYCGKLPKQPKYHIFPGKPKVVSHTFWPLTGSRSNQQQSYGVIFCWEWHDSSPTKLWHVCILSLQSLSGQVLLIFEWSCYRIIEVCVFIAIMLVNLVLALNTSCGQGCSQNTVDAKAEHGHTMCVRTSVQNGRSN